MTDHAPSPAEWIADASNAAQPWPQGWTARGDLISVCCECVQEGHVPAPPMARRTDGLCDAHFAFGIAEILRHKARQDGEEAVLWVDAGGGEA